METEHIVQIVKTLVLAPRAFCFEGLLRSPGWPQTPPPASASHMVELGTRLHADVILLEPLPFQLCLLFLQMVRNVGTTLFLFHSCSRKIP